MASILDSPGLPTRGTTPVFNEPWEARAFAIVVTLQQRGFFSWPEWTAALSQEIAQAQQKGDADLEHSYYNHWLRALEKVVAERTATAPQAPDKT
jgi:nitrile hydratase accessory protein